MGDTVLITFYMLTIITFFVTKKRLHLFEIIFCWLIVVFLHDVYFMIFTLNYPYVIPSFRLSDVFLRIGYQQIILPIIVLWAMEQWVAKRGMIYKLGSLLFFSIVLMLVKSCLYQLGIVQYSAKWKMEWSYLESLMLLGVTGIALLIYRAIMRKDGISYESS